MKYLILVRGAAWSAALADEMTSAGVQVAAGGLTGTELARGDLASPPATGFYLLDCASIDEAWGWVAHLRDVEVRPVLDPGGHEF
ncbi:hypothetical protein GCM10010172_74980 [Paractinoplanes ferrugineus]|uniref:YCII-related domain-containing protein n=1 Tax=Paractinoplanes ferrugineus TaxID=113564 RepID=A0A919J0W9_9ACTN|nr:hypothetical protein [Actinoplanes ferrugineus]GIE11347.1 hypothetical protein Afe05nite_31870 [Actinoplanes ferrugineus]